MIVRVSLFLALAAVTTGHAQTTNERAAYVCMANEGAMRASVQSYYACVENRAASLETSGGAAEEVAVAAMAGCGEEAGRVSYISTVCANYYSGDMGATFAALSRATEKQARIIAVRHLIELRAAKSAR